MTDPAQPPGPAIWPLPAGPAPDRGASTASPPPPDGPTAPPTTTARVLGLLLVAPALVLLLVQWLVPSVGALRDSLYDARTFDDRGDWVGLDNYRLTVSTVLGNAGPAPIVGAVAVAVVTVVGALGIAVAARAGGLPHRLARASVVVLLALVSPVAVATGWQRLLATDGSGPSGVLIVVLAHAPAATGLLALALMASSDRRGSETGRAETGRTRTATLVVLVVAALVAVAAGLQLFDLPLILGRQSGTLATAPVFMGFVMATLGAGAAAEVMLLAPLLLLGVATVVVVVGGRVRIVGVGGTGAGSGGGGGATGPAVVGVVAAVAALVVAVVAFVPVLAGWASPAPDRVGSLAGTTAMGLLPALLSATVQVTVSAAAGFGIGRLTPLGRRSVWLLAPFAPWVLCGRLPFALTDFTLVRELGLVDTWAALIPPAQVSPAVVLFATLVFAATRPDRGAERLAPIPAAGLIALAGAVITVAQASTVQWSYLVLMSPDSFTGPLTLWLVSRVGGGELPLPTAYAYGPVALVVSSVVAAAVVVATSRVGLRVGTPPDRTDA